MHNAIIHENLTSHACIILISRIQMPTMAVLMKERKVQSDILSKYLLFPFWIQRMPALVLVLTPLLSLGQKRMSFLLFLPCVMPQKKLEMAVLMTSGRIPAAVEAMRHLLLFLHLYLSISAFVFVLLFSLVPLEDRIEYEAESEG